MQHYIDMRTKYFDFSTTTSRRGYWMAFLFNFIVSLVIGVVAGLTGITALSTVYSVAVFIPSLAITIRRLRDTGKHWAWYFIGFVPLAGPIILLVMLCKPSVAQNTVNAAPVYEEYDY